MQATYHRATHRALVLTITARYLEEQKGVLHICRMPTATRHNCSGRFCNFSRAG